MTVAREPQGASPDRAPDPRLDDRIVDLLRRAPGAFAFNGLRRALAAHPESLSRSLRRLERLGVIARGEHGYALVAGPGPEEAPREPTPLRSVAAVELAPGVTRSDLLGRLAGRWFGSLRWVGVHERPGDPLLVWSVEGSDGHVLLGVRRGSLRLFVDRPRSREGTDALDRAARELLAHVLARLEGAPPSSFPRRLELRGPTAVPRPWAS